MANQDVTVKRLIGYLKTLPPEAIVILSRDSEGNGYKKLTDFGIGGVSPVTMNRVGNFGEMDVEVHSDDDAPKEAVPALIIYPD